MTAKEYKRKRKEWGKVKYTEGKCPHCGRYRMELFENGKEICEKCSYDKDTKKINTEHFELFNF